MSARSLVIAAASTMEELLSDYEFIRTSMSRLAGTINLRRELVPVAPRLRSNSQSRFRSSSQEDVLAQTEPAIRMLLDDPRMSRLAIPDPADRRHHRKPEPVNNLFIHTVGASSPEERDGFDFDISIDSAADERRRAPSRGKRSRASSSSASATPPYSPVSMSIPIPIPTLADARPSAARHTTSDETIYACGSFGDSATTTTTTGQSSRASTGSNKSLGAFSFFRRRSSTSTELSDAPFVAGKPVLRSTRPSQPIEPSGSVELSPPLSPQLQLAVGHHAAPVATRVTEQALIELFEQLRPYQTPNPNFARMLIDRYRSIGPYDIENKHLGAGSFSIVRLGMHRLRQEKVALKFFAKDHSQGEQMVQQELAILQGLHHPSIVTVYSILETEHHFCMALQYVPNGSLLEFLNKHWSVEFGCTESAVLFKQIVLGVEYLHANGIVHRDLKPDNILLGANMRPVLVDFGLSKVVRAPSQADPAARHESVRENCGTPIYAAPELMIGTTRNFPAIDVWALGVILFNLLTCEMPYDYEPSVMTMQQLYRNIQSQAFGAPLYVPKEAERLLRRTIVVDPERRMGVSDILQHPWLVDTVITGEESMVVSPSAAEKAADQAVTELMATLDRHDQQQWRLLRSDDVTAFAQRSKEPTTVVRVKCKTMIEASAERVVDLVSDFQRRREYDNFTTSIREVEKVGHHCSVWYFMDESALYFNKVTRDFCCVTKRVQKDGKYVVASTSATHSSCPPISGRVRGEVLPSGWVVEPIGDGRCWLTYLLALDLCGNVSSSLIKRIHQGVPMFLDKIRELAMSVER
ncbi:hypothetical protein CAOG_03852 [Capsaspora owczarzaki ATCC 30864]|nr:hypothetical protein CAOG_03852 [Capsaspora owczarzaki ATCC 30864]|eukprot:XP_004363580.2 hypothetical protein CAOG_03852 [Capsaspora owczarzaki ATCC 30864]